MIQNRHLLLNIIVRTTEAYLLVHFDAKLCFSLIKRGTIYTLKSAICILLGVWA